MKRLEMEIGQVGCWKQQMTLVLKFLKFWIIMPACSLLLVSSIMQIASPTFTFPLLSARSQCTFIQICPVTWHPNTLKEKLGLCIFTGPSRVQTWIHVRAKYISKAYKEPTTMSIRPWLDIALKESFQLREKCLARVATSKGYQQSRHKVFPSNSNQAAWHWSLVTQQSYNV